MAIEVELLKNKTNTGTQRTQLSAFQASGRALMNKNFAAAQRFKLVDKADEGGLAGAGWPADRYDLPRVYP